LEVESVVLGVSPSTRDRDRGVVHVQTTGRNQHGAVVLTYQRKVQVWKRNIDAPVDDATLDEIPTVECTLWLPPYDPSRPYKQLAHLSNSDTYADDLTVGNVIEHSRGRTMTSEHIALTAMLDNTSQVHCNQHMINEDPSRYIGGQLIIFGGIPFNLCLGLSCTDVGDNALSDLVYPTGRHTAPLFAGDTVFAATEITGKRDLVGRPDLCIVDTILRGYKYVRKDGAAERTEIFYLERALVVKRRAFYA
jgi:2-methylfumaryl-CoA hydratase